MFFLDFYYFYAGALILHAGGNIYDIQQLAEVMYRIGWPSDYTVSGFPYPPWSLYLFFFLGYFSFTQALLLWGLLSTVLISATIILINRYLNINQLFYNKNQKINYAELLFFIIVFPPITKLILYSQTGFIIFFGLYFALIRSYQKPDFLSGLFYSLSLIKPHLLLPLHAYIVCRSLKKKNFKFLFGIMLGLGLQLSFCLSQDEIFAKWFKLLEEFQHNLLAIEFPTLISLLVNQEVNVLVVQTYIIFIACLGAGLGFLYDFSLKNVISILIPVSLILAPYAWSHDMIVLYPLHILLVSKFFSLGFKLHAKYILFFILLLFYLSLCAFFERGAIFYPFLLLFLNSNMFFSKKKEVSL